MEEARLILGSGNSTATPLPLEASTAPGDSGGPAFVYTNDAWRVHGVVSYGTDNSTYGDVTIYTRIASHYDWIHTRLPNWHNAKFIGEGNWRESPGSVHYFHMTAIGTSNQTWLVVCKSGCGRVLLGMELFDAGLDLDVIRSFPLYLFTFFRKLDLHQREQFECFIHSGV